MASEIKCPSCKGLPPHRDFCHICRGKGVVVDVEAAPGGPIATSQLDRLPFAVVPAGGGVFVIASDGSMWVGALVQDEWGWERVADLPQHQREAT